MVQKYHNNTQLKFPAPHVHMYRYLVDFSDLLKTVFKLLEIPKSVLVLFSLCHTYPRCRLKPRP